jgi:hypothetical protein
MDAMSIVEESERLLIIAHDNKRPDARAARAEVSKPRLAVTRSTQINTNGGLTDSSQQRHVTHCLLSLSGFRSLRSTERDVGTIAARETKVMIGI